MANAKGIIFIEVVKYLRSRKEEAQSLLPGELQKYLDRRILATSWYPESDFLELMKTLISLRPSTSALALHPFDAAARQASDAYFRGPYKSLVHKGNPGRSLSKFDTLWKLTHDSGKLAVEVEEEAGLVRIADYAIVSSELCAVNQGTMWGLLHEAGARNIEFKHVRCRSLGDSLCEWRVTWS